MKRSTKAFQMGAVIGAVVLTGAVAGAIMRDPQCVHDANQTKKDCVATCQENFSVARDLCRNVNHECADACRAGRKACVDPIRQVLTDCLGGCQATLDQAKADCRADPNNPPGSTSLDTCIDNAQIAAFTCRDNCRESFNTQANRDALKNCRRIFHACITTCPPAN
jgi:hypothetical protein